MEKLQKMGNQIPFTDIELAINPEPRCPCVLLIDVSASMSAIVENVGDDCGYTVEVEGEIRRVVSSGTSRIDKVNEGLRAYHEDLMTDSLATQRVEVSVITFGGTVKTVVPFCSASSFNAPTLVTNGATPMGEAILNAIEAVEARKSIYRQNALPYYRPWIFFITDGAPTDSWEQAAKQVQLGEQEKKFAFFAVGVEGADFEILRRISVRKPLRLKGYSFREMFQWLSASQRSISYSTPGQEDQVKLLPPEGWANL